FPLLGATLDPINHGLCPLLPADRDTQCRSKVDQSWKSILHRDAGLFGRAKRRAEHLEKQVVSPVHLSPPNQTFQAADAPDVRTPRIRLVSSLGETPRSRF